MTTDDIRNACALIRAVAPAFDAARDDETLPDERMDGLDRAAILLVRIVGNLAVESHEACRAQGFDPNDASAVFRHRETSTVAAYRFAAGELAEAITAWGAFEWADATDAFEAAGLKFIVTQEGGAA